ncbi:MAG: hypothetical protein IIX77_05435 [Oscillospiraceae bacterium]|nr:hypothetical protein [Oscillospiraceae bacterium]
MKSKKQLFLSVFQLVIGAAATAAFIILDLGGESMTRWTITLVLAIAYMVMGIGGIADYLKADK